MKKKLTKKLTLSRKTISNLTDNEMNRVRGASLMVNCTNSCSLLVDCCPTTKENLIEQNPDEG